MSLITSPFAALLMSFCNMFHSYGWAILLFGLIVKLILLPFQMQSKKSMMRTTMLQPRMKELEKQCGSNKQKYNEEVAKLYKEAKVNPLSGCLWSFIPLFIIIPLYQVVRQPLSKMMALAAEEVTALTELVTKLGLYTAPARTSAYAEMTIANVLHENFDRILASADVSAFADKLANINFDFLGVNLTYTPKLFFWNAFEEYGVFVAVVLFIIPFASAGLSYLQMQLSTKMQKGAPAAPGTSSEQQSQTEQMTKNMNIMMPLMSVYICFIMPAAMGLYWIEQSILAIIQEAILNKFYQKKLDAEMHDFWEAQKAKDEEIRRKKEETEKLKAEGKTQVNTSTSKKRLAAQEKNAAEQKAAAKRAQERVAKGIVKEIPDSQVGNRVYARGRAYVADRYADEAAGIATEAPEAEVTEVAETAAAVEEVTAAVETVETAVAEVEETAAAVETAVEETAEIAEAVAEQIEENKE